MNFSIRRYSLPGVFLFLFLFVPGFINCSPNKLVVQEIVIERNGEVRAAIMAEMARTNEERNRGLMYRKSIKDGEGMLFIFESDQVLSFWMKNTIIPLSIAFIAWDGRIVEIKELRPNDLNSVRSSRSVRYALEVPQGWFERAGVTAGDFIVFDK